MHGIVTRRRLGRLSLACCSILVLAGTRAEAAAEAAGPAPQTTAPQDAAPTTKAPSAIALVKDLFQHPQALGADALTAFDIVANADGSVDVLGAVAAWTVPFGDASAHPLRILATAPDINIRGLERADGGYRAETLSVPSYSVHVFGVDPAGDPFKADVSASSFSVDHPSWRPLPTIADDPDKPFSRFAPVLSWLLTPAFDRLAVGPSVLTVDTVESTQVTRQGAAELGALADGTLQSYRVEPSVSEVRMNPGSERAGIAPVFRFGTGPVRAKLYSIAPLIEWLVAGASSGNGSAALLIGAASLGGMWFDIPGQAKVSIDAIGLRQLTVRPSSEPLLPVFDRLATETMPDEAAIVGQILDIERRFGLAALSIRRIAVDAKENGHGSVDSIAIDDWSGDGLGRFALGGLSIESPHVSARLGTFSLARIGFPSKDALLALQRVGADRDAAAVMAALPRLGGFAIEGGRLTLPGMHAEAMLDELRLELADTAGAVPTAAAFVLRGLAIPTATIPSPEATDVLRSLVGDTLRIGADAGWRFDADTKSLAIGPIRIVVPNGGRLDAAGEVRNVPATAFADPLHATVALATAALAGAEVAYVDHGLVEAALAAIARNTGRPVPVVEASLIDGLQHGLMSLLHDPAEVSAITGPVSAFLAHPDALVVRVRPPSPLPITAILGAAAIAPQSIPTLLGLEVETGPDAVPSPSHGAGNGGSSDAGQQ